jgi:hypothetical protein
MAANNKQATGATGMRAPTPGITDDTDPSATPDVTTTPTATADRVIRKPIPGADISTGRGAPETKTTPASDTALMPPPPLPENVAKATRQERHLIHLYHVAMLVLAQRPEKPIIHLDNPHAVRLLDAALTGHISEAGEVLYLPHLRSSKKILEYVEKCETYVPKLRARIHAQNKINLREPANLFDEGEEYSPAHRQLWKFIITPEMLSVFKKFLNKKKIRGEVEEPKTELKAFLEGLMEDQYDLDNWEHIETKAKPNMKPLVHANGARESFAPSTEHSGYIEAVMKVKNPGTERWIVKIDLIKDLQAPISKKIKTKTKKRAVYYDPDPKNVIIPKKKETSPWHTEDARKMLWTCSGGKVWVPHLFARKFDAVTGEYLKARFIDLELLRNIDPNDKAWREKYNEEFKKMGPSKKSWKIKRDPSRKPSQKRKRTVDDAQNYVDGEEDVFGGINASGDASPRKKAKIRVKKESLDRQVEDDAPGKLAAEGMRTEDFDDEIMADRQEEDEVEEGFQRGLRD